MPEFASPRRSRNAYLRWALVTIPAILLLGLLSAKLGDSSHANLWLARLRKPALMPPGWAFPAVSLVLYMMIGAALAFILHAHVTKGRGVAILLFLLQLGFNLAWSPVFFAMHRIMLAAGLVMAASLWAGIATLFFWNIRRVAALLMLPYLAWLLLVGLLNWQVHQLNPNGLILLPSTGDTQIIIQ